MSIRRTVGLAALACAMAGGQARAQTAAENRDADALAADMRILAANPLDIEALITAGELTLRMGDNTAAAGFFTRAEKLDPLNPRIKAGWGTLMLRAERPGEALRRFQEAAQRGLNPSKFAADRGLAYDLIGEQERAQRDYRLVLRDGPDDEVTRRYALSLGISGQKDEAMRVLEPLLKRSDRAAWRDRAFVMAMSGDTTGAQKIADTMMSPGLGAGLAPFFQRLPMLSPVDRAFAVTFGELRSTPERVADARMIPPLPALGPDPYAPKPVVVAVAAKPKPTTDEGKRKRRKSRDDALAPAVPAPSPPPPVEVALAPPAYRGPPPAPPAPMIQPLPTPKPAPTPVPPPPRVALSMPPASKSTPPPVESKPAQASAPTPAPAPLPPPVVVAAAPTPPIVPVPVPVPMPAPTPAPVSTPEPEPGVADQPSRAEAAIPPTATARAGEDRVLANIIAGISVPGSELGVAPMPARAAPPPPPPPPPPLPPREVAKPKPSATTPRGRPTRDAVPDDGSQALTGKSSSAKGSAKADTTATGGKSAKGSTKDKPETVALDRNGCPQPAAKGKSSNGKTATTTGKTRGGSTSKSAKAGDTRCKSTDTKDDKSDRSTKGEPARIWVQVAGGANESTLLKAWNALKDKAPDALRGRQGWTTPLRNTNRVLTGPFKTADDAQAFVNQLAKAGITGFVFTSDKGQKIERLSGK